MPESTPPNWPIYNVKLSKAQIEQITTRTSPQSKLVSYAEIEKQKSFNNRIYFLSLRRTPNEGQPEDVVLKVIGRFFSGNKIQNEVASLLLLEKYSPEVPAPRVLAWSEDGTRTNVMRGGVFTILHDSTTDETVLPAIPHGWILMSKCPGRPLQLSDLRPVNDDLVNQLADYYSSWRKQIPHQEVIGNLALQPAISIHELETIVSGLFLCDTQPDQPPKTAYDYYSHLLLDQLHKINTKDVFAYLRPRLSDSLEAFRTSTLLTLNFPASCSVPDLSKPDTTTSVAMAEFTHQDFSPRNILVVESNSGLSVTGILDFEFSGFFPPFEEYLTCMVRQESDWDSPFFTQFLSKLAERGIPVPGKGIDLELFTDASDLVKMIENVAPWWLQDGHMQGEELERQLGATCKVVEDLLARLERIDSRRKEGIKGHTMRQLD